MKHIYFLIYLNSCIHLHIIGSNGSVCFHDSITTGSTCENEGDFNKFSSRDLLKCRSKHWSKQMSGWVGSSVSGNFMYTFYSVRLKIIQEEKGFLRDVHFFKDNKSLWRTGHPCEDTSVHMPFSIDTKQTWLDSYMPCVAMAHSTKYPCLGLKLHLSHYFESVGHH